MLSQFSTMPWRMGWLTVYSLDRETASSPIQKSMSSTPFHSFRAEDLASFVPITDGMMYDGSTFDA